VINEAVENANRIGRKIQHDVQDEFRRDEQDAEGISAGSTSIIPSCPSFPILIILFESPVSTQESFDRHVRFFTGWSAKICLPGLR
jgi:hypothetical protein